MGAFPTSDWQAHQSLHERVHYALDRCQESPAADFKESQLWSTLKLRIVKTSLAMANLRDGGVIIVGASESGSSWSLPGISDDHLKSYDVDDLKDTVNKYASPDVELDIVIVPYQDDKQFLAIYVREFNVTPIVCKKGFDGELRAGGVYVRPHGKPRSTHIRHASDMQKLLELATDKRARRFLERAHWIGMVPGARSVDRFDEELGGL